MTETNARPKQILRRMDPAKSLERELAVLAKQKAALVADAAKLRERIDGLGMQLEENANARQELDAAAERTKRALEVWVQPALEVTESSTDAYNLTLGPSPLEG